jgi:hypothetical protein
MPHLRLVTDEPEIDPPAPLPISSWRAHTSTANDPTIDTIADVERAMSRLQAGIDSLNAQLDDADPFPFPGRNGGNDDGPYAA